LGEPGAGTRHAEETVQNYGHCGIGVIGSP